MVVCFGRSLQDRRDVPNTQLHASNLVLDSPDLRDILPDMRRLITRLLLVCLLFSAPPLAQAVDSPKTHARAARRARQVRKVNRHKRAQARWAKTRRAHRRSSRV